MYKLKTPENTVVNCSTEIEWNKFYDFYLSFFPNNEKMNFDKSRRKNNCINPHTNLRSDLVYYKRIGKQIINVEEFIKIEQDNIQTAINYDLYAQSEEQDLILINDFKVGKLVSPKNDLYNTVLIVLQLNASGAHFNGAVIKTNSTTYFVGRYLIGIAMNDYVILEDMEVSLKIKEENLC